MTAAGQEEQAELEVLRERAAASGRDLSQTAAALAGKLAESARPHQATRWARHRAHHWARHWARHRVRRWTARPHHGARQWARHWAARARQGARPKLAASAALLLVAVAAVTWHHRRHP